MRTDVGPCRRTTASIAAALMALVVFALAAPAHAADCAFADAQPGEASAADLSAATVCLLNERRAAAGLPPVVANASLGTTAERYAQYMVSDEHFAHQDESGHNVVWRVLQADPSLADRWLVIGENLGWGTYALATPRSMVEGWMESPTHRDNVLYPKYDEIGVGIVDGAPVPGRSSALTYATVYGKVAPTTSTTTVKRHRPACRRARRARTRAARIRAKRACAARARARARARAARAAR
jgi:uncharacterized protein YkwD